MAAWRDEKSHVTSTDAAAAASRGSLRFQTRLLRRAPGRGGGGTRVNTIGTAQKLCSFFFFFIPVHAVPAQQTLRIVLILMPVLIFHFGGAERGSLVPAFTNYSTDSWRGLLAGRSQMRNSSAVQTPPLIDQQQHQCASRHLCRKTCAYRPPFLRSSCAATIMGL